jgi:lipopolysaccharide export system permease protein
VERNRILSKEKMISKYLVEIHKKYSVPVACVVFVLIGIPLGIVGRPSGRAVAIGISMGFFLLYWAFLIGGEELADRLLVSPAAAMWAPNIVIGAAGIVLMLRAVREGTVVHWERLAGLLSLRSRRRPAAEKRGALS